MPNEEQLAGVDGGPPILRRCQVITFDPAKIKAFRIAAKVTQGEAAKCIGVSRPTFIALEQGKRKMTGNEWRKLTALYGLDENLRPRPLQLPLKAGVKDIPALLSEIDRLRAIERDYRRLLLDHLRVMRDNDGYYHSAGNRTCADIMRKLAGLGLFEIVATGPENGVMGRLTDEGRQMLGGEE